VGWTAKYALRFAFSSLQGQVRPENGSFPNFLKKMVFLDLTPAILWDIFTVEGEEVEKCSNRKEEPAMITLHNGFTDSGHALSKAVPSCNHREERGGMWQELYPRGWEGVRSRLGTVGKEAHVVHWTRRRVAKP
jgi:hypothetical protein